MKKNRFLSAFVAIAIAVLAIGPVVPAMAATLVGRITIQADINYSSDLDFQSIKAPLSRSVAIAFTSGTGSGQASKLFSDQRSLSSGGTENLDLAGSLADAFGTTITFATVKGIIIEAATTNTVDVTFGGAASAQFVGPLGSVTDTIAVRPGGVILLVAPQTGWTVTATTADLLKVLAGAAASTYNITIIGT